MAKKDEFRIDMAYCKQLGRVVGIQEACKEFGEQTEHKSFNFFCSDPACRSSSERGVRVSAPNHHRSPTEEILLKRPHFRKLDEHIEDCFWSQLNKVIDDDFGDIEEEEHEEQKQIRALRRVLTRLVTRFEVPPVDGQPFGPEGSRELDEIRNTSDPDKRKERIRRYLNESGSTAHSLADLVTCYEELKERGALEQISVTVARHGRWTFKDLFTPFHLKSRAGFSIQYGGAWLGKKRYGNGFVLNFMDRVNGLPVSLYISSKQLSAYRHKGHILSLISEVERSGHAKYVRVYWIGELATEVEKKLSVDIQTLDHVVFRIVVPKSSSANDG